MTSAGCKSDLNRICCIVMQENQLPERFWVIALLLFMMLWVYFNLMAMPFYLCLYILTFAQYFFNINDAF